MAEATNLNETNPAPLPGDEIFTLKMQGLLTAGIYSASYWVSHAAAQLPLLEARNLGVFLAGLVIFPLAVGFPMALFDRAIAQDNTNATEKAIAFAPFLRVAVYGLAAVGIWIATREAHQWIFTTLLER